MIDALRRSLLNAIGHTQATATGDAKGTFDRERFPIPQGGRVIFLDVGNVAFFVTRNCNAGQNCTEQAKGEQGGV